MTPVSLALPADDDALARRVLCRHRPTVGPLEVLVGVARQLEAKTAGRCRVRP